MDLQKHCDTVSASERGAFLHLVSPKTGEPLYAEGIHEGEDARVGIHVLGPDSKVVRDYQRERSREQLAKVQVTKKGMIKGLSKTNREIDGLRFLARVCVRFQHVDHEGRPVETEEDKIALLGEVPWVSEQVDEFFDDRRNFLGN